VKPFSDIRVRKAMQLAIDLATINKALYNNIYDATPQSLTASYLAPAWGYPYSQWPKDLQDEYAYNVPAAKQLLADAGYPDGFHTDVVVDSAADLDLFQAVESYLQVVGITMDVKTMDNTSWINYVQVNHSHDALAYKTLGLLGASYSPMDHAGCFLVQMMGSLQVYGPWFTILIITPSIIRLCQELPVSRK